MKQVNDRFTFDNLFRKLLKGGADKEEALNYILSYYSLSSFVLQERIENKYYLKINHNEEISPHLEEFKNEIFKSLLN